MTGLRALVAWAVIPLNIAVVLWVALVTVGLPSPALDDDDHGGAWILLRISGQTPLSSAASGLLWTWSSFVSLGAVIGLLITLIISISRKQQAISPRTYPLPHARIS